MNIIFLMMNYYNLNGMISNRKLEKDTIQFKKEFLTIHKWGPINREFQEFRIKSGKINSYYNRDKVFNLLLNQTELNNNNPSSLYTDLIFSNDLIEDLKYRDLYSFWEDVLKRSFNLLELLEKSEEQVMDLTNLRGLLYPKEFSEVVRQKRPIIEDILSKIKSLLASFELELMNYDLKQNIDDLFLDENKNKLKFNEISNFELEKVNYWRKIEIINFFHERFSNKVGFNDNNVDDFISNVEHMEEKFETAIPSDFKQKIYHLYDELEDVLQTLENVRVENFKPQLLSWLVEIRNYKNLSYFKKLNGLKWIYNELSDRKVLNQWFLRMCEKMKHWYLSEFSKEVFKIIIVDYKLTPTEKRLFIVMNIGLKVLDYRLPTLEPILTKYFLMEEKEFQNFLNLDIYKPTDTNAEEWKRIQQERSDKKIIYRNKMNKYLKFYPIFRSIITDEERYRRHDTKIYDEEDRQDKINNAVSEDFPKDVEEIPELFLKAGKNQDFEFLDELKKVCTSLELKYIYYCYVENRTQTEIAKIFNVTQPNVQKTIKRALRKLKESKIIKDIRDNLLQ